MVEQQYRHRLHARFEALLDVLPERLLHLDSRGGGGDYHDEGGGGEMGGRGGGMGLGMGKGVIGGRVGKGGGGNGKGVKGKNNRRMSKVDVLNTATRVIQCLTGDLERKRRQVEGWKREREMAFAARSQGHGYGHGHDHGHGQGGGWGLPAGR
jgi:hypothetical protein